MTKTNMDLSVLLQKHDQGDFLHAVAEAVLQLIMEADVEGLTGALLDRMTHHVSILEMNGDSYRLAQSRAKQLKQTS